MIQNESNLQHDLSKTIVAQATPIGSGAIAVIRMSGSQTFTILKKFFKNKRLETAKSHSVLFGNFVDSNGTVIDEVLVSIFRNPTSYTKEDIAEISCHGSSFIINQIIKILIEGGAQLAQKGEFTMRAFLNGQMDLAQAEAVADLIASTSEKAHQMAMAQLKGNISKQIQALRERLINFASLMELELDFSEEDVEFADRTELVNLLNETNTTVSKLLESFDTGNAIKKGIPTVIAGRPNSGKSTLLNSLLKEERAIVSDIAGTTRDTVEEVFILAGMEFRLIDTAGIRQTDDVVESIGVQKAIEKIKGAALLLFVFDASTSTVEEVQSDIEKYRIPNQEIILIANKLDKISPAQKTVFESLENMIFISAKDTSQIDVLEHKISDWASQKMADDILISNHRHYEALQKTKVSLLQVLQGLEHQMPTDLIAIDIRQALHTLGEISGIISTDDLLDNIFSNFCIGK